MHLIFIATVLGPAFIRAETCYPKLPVCQPNASCCADIPECDWAAVVNANPHAENSEWFDPCAALIPATCMISMEGHLVSAGPDYHCISSNALSWQWPEEHSCVDGFVLAAGSAVLIDVENVEGMPDCKTYTLSVAPSSPDICTAVGADTYPLVYSKGEDWSFVVDRDIAINRGSIWRISSESTCPLTQSTPAFHVAMHAVLTKAGIANRPASVDLATPLVPSPIASQPAAQTSLRPVDEKSSAANLVAFGSAMILGGLIHSHCHF